MRDNPTITDIKNRLLRGESLDFIERITGVPKEMIRKAFGLNKSQ